MFYVYITSDKLMKHFLLFILILVSGMSFGQNSDEWTLFQSVEGVNFYKKETDCTPNNIPSQTGILIKIENTNSYEIKAEWDLRIWYSGEEQTANIKDQENHITISIPKKQEKAGDCSNPNGSLYLFKKFITFSGGEELTNFQFDQLTVNKIKR